MKEITHTTAKPSHYNKEADSYDTFNENNSQIINETIASLLKKYKVKSVLDFSAGTGSQVYYLNKLGYDVLGVDINSKMLAVAKSKIKKSHRNIKFIKGDMRNKKVGKYDAVITIFNSIGHLAKADFKLAIKNIKDNLNPGGLYIFDIFNLDFLLKDDNITKLTIDWQKKVKNKIIREIQYSTINEAGMLASYDIYHEQEKNKSPEISHAYQTLQTYNKQQLKDMLSESGFNVLQQCDIDGARAYRYKTERLLTVAKKSL